MKKDIKSLIRNLGLYLLMLFFFIIISIVIFQIPLEFLGFVKIDILKPRILKVNLIIHIISILTYCISFSIWWFLLIKKKLETIFNLSKTWYWFCCLIFVLFILIEIFINLITPISIKSFVKIENYNIGLDLIQLIYVILIFLISEICLLKRGQK